MEETIHQGAHIQRAAERDDIRRGIVPVKNFSTISVIYLYQFTYPLIFIAASGSVGTSGEEDRGHETLEPFVLDESSTEGPQLQGLVP